MMKEKQDRNSVFPRRLRGIMDYNRITQKHLAEMLGIKCQQLGRYTTGCTDPSLKTLASIAKALNVSTDYLLGLTDECNVGTSWK